MQSVFPQSELATFMSLTKADKEQQLSELTMIVTGIRLFNKDFVIYGSLMRLRIYWGLCESTRYAWKSETR